MIYCRIPSLSLSLSSSCFLLGLLVVPLFAKTNDDDDGALTLSQIDPTTILDLLERKLFPSLLASAVLYS
jgi:hypothetical protein